MIKKFIAIVALALSALSAFAQDEEYYPTTTWPYVYADFMPGTLQMYGGAQKSGQFNVCIANGTVHFIDATFIKEVAPVQAFSLEVGKDVYVNVNSKMMKVLAKNDNGLIVQGVEIDEVTLNSTGGAYGSSSASTSTTALSSMEGIGSTGSLSTMNHMELKNSRADGKELPLIEKTYLVVDSKVIFATKKDVSQVVNPDAAKAFFKANKIKWKDPVSLLTVVDFVHSQANEL